MKPPKHQLSTSLRISEKHPILSFLHFTWQAARTSPMSSSLLLANGLSNGMATTGPQNGPPQRSPNAAGTTSGSTTPARGFLNSQAIPATYPPTT